MKAKITLLTFSLVLILNACKESSKNDCLDVKHLMDIAVTKYQKVLAELPDTALMPGFIPTDEDQWHTVSIYDWTSGFFPGVLWYLYEYTGEQELKEAAAHWTAYLEPVSHSKNKDHDLGFMMYCSYGNGYRLTGDLEYRDILLETADSLSKLYNPNVGTILSWPSGKRDHGWSHNTIIDNMMNLELLFWAGKAGNSPKYKEIAVNHAETTRKNHIRTDFSTYHVAVYDSLSGEFQKGVTHQGYADNSMWARGQAWGIYGFTMVYDKTGDSVFLETAVNLANKFLSELPEDKVPYWDFNAPAIPDEPKDASAAAIAASGMIKLATLITDPELKKHFHDEAVEILKSLSTHYLADENKASVLVHSVGSKPHHSGIDYSLIYADYYFLEALLREDEWQKNNHDNCK